MRTCLTDEARDAFVAGHGMLGDDAAVFGFSFSAELPPAWVDDDAEAGRRICAKRDDVLGADVWWRVAEVARTCRRLAGRASARDDRQFEHVREALRASRRAADLLPWPLPVVCALPDPLGEPAAMTRVAGPRRDLVDAAAARLCAALDDPGWTDPDALAGWVDDAVLALRRYGIGLLASDRSAFSV